MEVVLDADALSECYELSQLRLENNAGRWGEEKMLKGPSDYREFLGICGELAFSLLTGLPWNSSQDPKVMGGKPDFILPDGRTLDVKTQDKVGRPSLNLKAKKYKHQDYDFYVLMVREGNTYHYMGYATKEELIQGKNLRDPDQEEGVVRKPFYTLPANKLHKELPFRGGK